MANARGKAIDNTHLSIDQAEERLIRHRDFFSHAFRWAHVARFLGSSGRYKTARVLDIGCGVDLPLARMLYSNRFIPEDFVGVDYNDPSKFKVGMFEKGRFPLHFYGVVDAAKDLLYFSDQEYQIRGIDEGHRYPNVITCFEVLEHIEPEHCRRMMKMIHEMLSLSKQAFGGDPIAFISTPCYDAQVGAADNHVSEITRQALGAMLEDLGFEVVKTYGTFASIRDYKETLEKDRPELIRFWNECHEYYDTNLLANIFAPIFPEHSRNNLWVLKPAKEGYVRSFPRLIKVPGPWTSSREWEGLAG
jgi:hypothetical protein